MPAPPVTLYEEATAAFSEWQGSASHPQVTTSFPFRASTTIGVEAGVVVMERNVEANVICVNAQLANVAVTSPQRVMREDERAVSFEDPVMVTVSISNVPVDAEKSGVVSASERVNATCVIVTSAEMVKSGVGVSE